MKSVHQKENFTATQNACNLCAPLGAAFAFKGIANAMPLLHGSQGCSTYIRRYMISHFKEPLDIACSNFGEETAIFGGGANLKLAIDNIRKQYHPELIGVATTCLSETIGDDVPMFIKAYRDACRDDALPALVHVSTPSYQGTHMQGFHGAVRALISTLAESTGACGSPSINLFPGMMSPADLRCLKTIMTDFDLDCTLVPDYSDTLNGPLWTEYQQIPEGGTPVSALRRMGDATISIECGLVLAGEKETAGTWLKEHFDVPLHRIGLPIGIRQSDRFFELLSTISGRPVPKIYTGQRGRLLDAMVDGHKHLNGVRAALFGEEDLVAGLAAFCAEVGIIPVLCATGGGNGRFAQAVRCVVPEACHDRMQIMEDVDFVTIEKTLEKIGVDLLIGHSKGYTMSRRLKRPLIRVGFPVHDRVDGSRLLHLGYRGAQQLFDRIANTVIEKKQEKSTVGYTYM
ncbi:nitrogenase [Desulfosarcina alkanivorans]|uniref:Nitrogenase n=1 Tax=Desulfosarcina alkanivorans TaxID=571177 RepID=A0A5K7YRU1_9BACT|nr:nitrogenase component 1 [Desulfosarcina alkanivorans]BBO71065.1 nitrogenase [Desulfosarcina alkanivorans]